MQAWSYTSIRKRTRLVVRSLITLIMVVLAAHRQVIHATVAFAQAAGGWSEPRLLSVKSARSWFADVVVDGQGQVHVVWDSFIPPRRVGDSDVNVTMYAVRTPDGTWSEPNDIALGKGSEVSRPAITADRAGLLHMVLRPSGMTYYSQAKSEDAYSAWAWRDSRRLTSHRNYISDIEVDSRGVIHAVWSEWVPVDLSEEEILQAGRSPYLSDILYRRSVDGGATWSAPLSLSRTFNVGSSRAQIKIDTRDGIHVTWDEGWDRNAQGDFAGSSAVCGMYTHSLDGGYTWSMPQVFDMPYAANVQVSDAYSSYEAGLRQLLSRMDRASSRYSEALVCQKRLVENISEARDVGDSEVLALERAVIISRLDDLALSVAGISFSELGDLDASVGGEVIGGLPQADNSQMTLGLDNDDGVLLLWRSAGLRRIYYTWSEDHGNTWGAAEPVPGIYVRVSQTPFDAYDTATDSLGRIHVVLVATAVSPEITRSGPIGVYHLTWDGRGWSEPDLIAYYPGLSSPEYPKIAVGQGNHLHVVWFVRSGGGSMENMQIWYSELKTDAPAEEPAPTPTPTATPVPTATPLPTATVTPFPTLVPGTSQVPRGLYTENDELAQLAVALLPIVLLVVAAAAVRIWR